MPNVAISVEGLGKRYRIGAAAERHEDLRSALTAAVKAPFRNLSRLRGLSRFNEGAGEENTVWALKDVSFEVKHGEVLGIIGRNGAGKSTLLKILSRITEPTTGRVRVNGRVGALLEVGTGFHPELTGRENVYLNGSILGMDKRYIDRKFAEIVEFSGVEKFIDTPVKRYSSGMYLRLAFSVAAHLEPEILVVDEVLAVGDAEFQKKCLGKMGEVAGEGRTVLFVSHNMGAVGGLCSKALLLENGGIVFGGPAGVALERYVSGGSLAAEGQRRWDGDEAPGDGTVRLRGLEVQQPPGTVSPHVEMQRPFAIEVEYEVEERIAEMNISILLVDVNGAIVVHTTSNLGMNDTEAVAPGRYRRVCTVPADLLNAGQYTVHVGADEPFIRMLWYVENAVRFTVETTCPLMGRYALGSYKGAISPRAVQWNSLAAKAAHNELLAKSR